MALFSALLFIRIGLWHHALRRAKQEGTACPMQDSNDLKDVTINPPEEPSS